MDRTIPSYAALLAVKYASRLLYSVTQEWVGEVPEDPWRDIRLIAVLNHTSLAEGINLAVVPDRVLRRIARHAVVPVARETMDRRIEGWIFRTLIPNVVPITRRRDDTWARVLNGIDDPDSLVTIFPEGRMMRPTGLDKTGAPMTVKKGIAEVLLALGHGRMVVAYSGGLHHVFRPGAKFPRFFKAIHLKLENLDIATYIEERQCEDVRFSDAVVRDLTRRRDLHTPVAPGTPRAVHRVIRRRRKQVMDALKRWSSSSSDSEE